MAKWELNHLTDDGHLLAATTNVVVADGIEGGLLLLALDGLTLAVDHSLGSNDAVWGGISVDNLEFNSTHSTLGKEEIT